jgi:enoyl-CoA hydratase/carnithine racemase
MRTLQQNYQCRTELRRRRQQQRQLYSSLLPSSSSSVLLSVSARHVSRENTPHLPILIQACPLPMTMAGNHNCDASRTTLHSKNNHNKDHTERWNSTNATNGNSSTGSNRDCDSDTTNHNKNRTTGNTNTTNDTSDGSKLVTMSVDARGICTIALNRPHKLNALNLPLLLQLQSILRTIKEQQDQQQQQSFLSLIKTNLLNTTTTTTTSTSTTPIRVILVHGNGRAFCTGLDINAVLQESYCIAPSTTISKLLSRHPLPTPLMIRRHSPPPKQPSSQAISTTDVTPVDATTTVPTISDPNPSGETTDTTTTFTNDDHIPDWEDAVSAVARTTNLVQDIAYLWRQLHVPVIGCIHGMCYGGGLQMILGMDIRYVQRYTTQLSIMESKWGLIPDMGASITLRELISIDIAKELTFTGRIITGEEAVQYGLVTKCVDDPIKEGTQLAIQLLDKSPDVLRYSKQLFQSTYRTGRSEEDCLQLEQHYQTKLLFSYNQIIASLRSKFGWNCIPYWVRK